MAALRVLILSDGRPGHFNLSEGIAAAIARLSQIGIERLDVRRGGWPGLAVATLANAHIPATTMLRVVYGIDPAAIPPADIVVSAGAETLGASIWISRSRNIPNVFYGSLRLFEPADFSLVLTSYARNASRPNHALALKPSRFDPDRIPMPRRTTGEAPSPPCMAALLLGGNAGGISYAETDWDPLIAFLSASNATLGTRWLVSNSRRTPSGASNRIASLAAAADSPIHRFIDVRAGNADSLDSILEAAEAVVCTEDSSSMVSEAIWARRPVIGIRPANFKLPADECQYRSWLTEQRWQASVEMRHLSADAFMQALAGLKPLEANPLAALADLLASRIPLLATYREPTAPTERT